MSTRALPPADSPSLPGVPFRAEPAYGPPARDAWAAPPPEDVEGIPWARYFDVLRRHMLLILALASAGSFAGLIAARRVNPIYHSQTTLWINDGSNEQTQTGPIRAQQLLPHTSWVELLRSFSIVDPVVRKLRLNVSYKLPQDSVLFRGFESAPNLKPGAYVLIVDRLGRSYRLTNPKDLVL
jgi:hypothetical protein